MRNCTTDDVSEALDCVWLPSEMSIFAVHTERRRKPIAYLGFHPQQPYSPSFSADVTISTTFSGLDAFSASFLSIVAATEGTSPAEHKRIGE